MSPRAQSVIVGLSGIFAGIAVSRIIAWSTLPKAITVGIIAGVVSTRAPVIVRFWAPRAKLR